MILSETMSERIKKIVLVFISCCLMLFVSACNDKDYSGEEISSGYIAVFHGGSGELTHETYIYKLDNNKANEGFKYINTESWGMTAEEWQHKITDKGEVTWTDDVFTIAYGNNAYSFVTLPNSTKTYTIEEYKNMFLMN